MPTFIKNNDIKGFLAFEKSYEPLFGLTALAVQVVTGLLYAKQYRGMAVVAVAYGYAFQVLFMVS